MWFLDADHGVPYVESVTSTSDERRAPPRYRLQTFGTLRLVGSADDTVLGDSGHQRRRLALLAVLAAAGEQGRSRDQLLGLFWPEVSQERARHSLGQLLYAIRTSLDEDLFTRVNPLRLNAAVLDSDIGRFADALARADLEAAVELHHGRFLDGFYLSDSPEFEQWMEAERARIDRSYSGALERLAKRAAEANDFLAASRWQQKLIETDPLSSKYATGLIRALENAGDHASALRYAERYEALLGEELGTSVGPAVAALVAEVRARANTTSVIVRGAPRPAQPERPDGSPPTAPATRSVIDPRDVASHRSEAPAPRVRPRRPAAAVFGIAALALVALVAVGSFLRLRNGSGAPSARGDPSIAVLPLANLSGNSRDAALVDGISE